jgi:TetR/AcrR family transcriptional regulator, transcriptional repressor for nem operon
MYFKVQLKRVPMKQRFARGAETRLRIIQIAADLFHKQGVRATSPDQVIDLSATGKGQFYYYFKNKEDLVHEVLQMHLEAIKTDTAPIPYEIGSWHDLERWFRAQLDLQKNFEMTRGCPFGTIGNEVTDNDTLIRQDLSLIFEVVKNKLAAFFIKEKARGRLAKESNEQQMADFCIAAIQGAMLMGKIKRDSRLVETVIRESLGHLKSYTIMPRV